MLSVEPQKVRFLFLWFCCNAYNLTLESTTYDCNLLSFSDIIKSVIGLFLPFLNSLRQICPQIINAFNADVQPNQSVRDADFLPYLIGNGCVGHAGGMADEALYTAQAFRQSDQIQRFEESMNVLLQQIQYCSSQQF